MRGIFRKEYGGEEKEEGEYMNDIQRTRFPLPRLTALEILLPTAGNKVQISKSSVE